MRSPKIDVNNIDSVIFDFDGVLTDNKVYVDQRGRETVCCHRGDGLALQALACTRLKVFILSREANRVVRERAKKLKIPVVANSLRKVESCRDLSRKWKFSLGRTMYVGNDLNDYEAMKACGYSCCPADSHPQVIGIADVVLKTAGGQGIARELLEDVLGLDLLRLLKSKNRV